MRPPVCISNQKKAIAQLEWPIQPVDICMSHPRVQSEFSGHINSTNMKRALRRFLNSK